MELLLRWRIRVWDLACGGMMMMMISRQLRRWWCVGGYLLELGLGWGVFQSLSVVDGDDVDGFRDMFGATDAFSRDLQISKYVLLTQNN